jgi:hypothetical protein
MANNPSVAAYSKIHLVSHSNLTSSKFSGSLSNEGRIKSGLKNKNMNFTKSRSGG